MKKESKKPYLVSKKSLAFCSFALIFVVFFSTFFALPYENKMSSFLTRIVSSWVAGNGSIGKIKFVSNDNVEEAVNLFDIKFSVPFKNGTLTQNDDGTIVADGKGEVMVVCAYPSTVKKINDVDGKRTVTFDCGYGVTVTYYNLDNIGVKVGNRLKRDDAVGVCNDSVMKIEILHNGKKIKKLKVKNGTLSLG